MTLIHEKLQTQLDKQIWNEMDIYITDIPWDLFNNPLRDQVYIQLDFVLDNQRFNNSI